MSASTTLANELISEQNTSQPSINSALVQDHEGNIYRTVTIGKQIWLAENLRVTKFQDGSKVNTGFFLIHVPAQ